MIQSIIAMMLATAAPATPAAMPSVTVERQAFGPFTLVERTYRRDPGQAPILHIAQDYSTLVLEFGDESYRVMLADNGAVLSYQTGGLGCSSVEWPLAYSGRAGEGKLFDGLVRFTARMGKGGCARDRAAYAAFVARLRASRADFNAAVEVMKLRAQAVMGGWKWRCKRGNDVERMLRDAFDPCLRTGF